MLSKDQHTQYESDVRTMQSFIINDVPTTPDRMGASTAFHRLMILLGDLLANVEPER